MDLHIYRNAQDRWYDLRTAAKEHGAVLAVNAVTLGELIQRLTPDAHVATAGQKLVLVSRALQRTGTIFGSGAVRYAFDAITELKAAGVRDADSAGDLLAAYENALHGGGLVDPQDQCWIAASRVSKHGSEWLQRFERVVLHAVYDLTEAEFHLIRNLIEVLPGGGTVILFNATANVKPTQFAEWTWQRFVRDDLLAERTFPEFCHPNSSNRELIERLFVFEPPRETDSPQSLEPSPALHILQAPGRYREIEAIGSQILDLIDRGENANDIAVVVRHIDTYGEMIEDVFSRYAIPHVFETGVPLLRIPFIKYWLAFLDLVTGERSRDALSRVMASAYFRPRLSPAIDVETKLAACGYVDRRHLPASDLARRKNSPLTCELQNLETRIDGLEQAIDTIPNFMRQLEPPSVLTWRDRQAWRELAEELQSMDLIAGKVAFLEFRRLASEIAALRTTDRLAEHGVAPGLPRVRITKPQSLGYRDYGWIFVPGMADGEFPAYAPSNPFLQDEIVERINRRIGARRLFTSRDRSRREPLFLFMVLDSARKRVTLTFPDSTLEGEPMHPSIYIAEIARHFSGPCIRQLDVDLPVREQGECLRRIAGEWRTGAIDDRAARELLGSEIVRRAQLEARGFRRADIARCRVENERPWHPSELNALAACPFVFLARHRLKLRTVDLPDFDVPQNEVGKLAHDILRSFYSKRVPVSMEEAMTRMDEAIARHLAPVDNNGQGPYSVFDPALWKIRRGQLVAALREYVGFAVRDAQNGYETVPEYLDSPLPCASMGSIQLAGRPDHVAVRRWGNRVEAIRIDDFKYSAASSNTNKQLRDSFQIPVYAYLAARTLDADCTARLEGRYLLLRSPSTPVVSYALDDTVFSAVRLRIEALIENVREGRFHPDPADPAGSCPTCEYRRLCRLYGE